MKKPYFLIIFTFATLLYFCIIVTLGIYLFDFFNAQKITISNGLATQSQKTNDLQSKILLSEYSNMLNSNDLAKIQSAVAYHQLNNKNAAENKLLELKDLTNVNKFIPADGSVSQKYYWLKDNSYPQLADIYIMSQDQNTLNRDEIILLAQAQISRNMYNEADTALKLALGKDKFYPQIYEQLLITCEKVEINNCNNYREKLSKVTW